MRTIKILHFISHFRWLFFVWMMSLMIYIFLYQAGNIPQMVGTVIFLAGIMMGLTSLSDITKVSEKEKKELSNPKLIKRQLIFFFVGVIVLILISALFLSLRLIFPGADEAILKDFTKLGYDCLVMMLGFLCLIKQFIDKVEFVKGLAD